MPVSYEAYYICIESAILLASKTDFLPQLSGQRAGEKEMLLCFLMLTADGADLGAMKASLP